MTITSLINTDKEIVYGGMFNSGCNTEPLKSKPYDTEPLKSEPLWIGDWLENGCRQTVSGWVYDAAKNKIGPQPYDDSDRSTNAESFRKTKVLKLNEQYE